MNEIMKWCVAGLGLGGLICTIISTVTMIKQFRTRKEK